MSRITWTGENPRTGTAPCGCRMVFSICITGATVETEWLLGRCQDHGGTFSKGRDNEQVAPEWSEFLSRGEDSLAARLDVPLYFPSDVTTPPPDIIPEDEP